MTSKQRKSMIEGWIKDINPKAILRAADARCGASMPSMSNQYQESMAQNVLTTCHWNSLNSTFWGYFMPMNLTSE